MLFYYMDRPATAFGSYPRVEAMVWPQGYEPSQLIMKWAPPLSITEGSRLADAFGKSAWEWHVLRRAAWV